MRDLYIIRHAKSSWKDESLDDFDRPLNKRGKRDAPAMADRLKSAKVSPDLLLSSPANRALTTAQHIAEGLSISPEEIETNEELYLADPQAILDVIRAVPDSVNTLFIFGHNPGLTIFANELADTDIDNIPTTGVVRVRLAQKRWKDIDWRKGELVFFDFPKNKLSPLLAQRR
ncbi:histidine phosphatase family protein [Roseivirga sp. BDSF3-8]|uniref:SixA phosphatase family protein n=1 Tax=Roseivirga sp. BDSF3-8 TaxID=3241598 RepID=UPI0035327FA2